MHFMQISADWKSDTDEVALYISLNGATIIERATACEQVL